MKVGSEPEQKRTELTEAAIKAKVKQHGESLQKVQEQIQKTQNNLVLLVDQAKYLQGAIRGLQDLLPQTVPASDLSEKGKDVPDEIEAATEEKGTGETEKDVPQVVDVKPVDNAQPSK